MEKYIISENGAYVELTREEMQAQSGKHIVCMLDSESMEIFFALRKVIEQSNVLYLVCKAEEQAQLRKVQLLLIVRGMYGIYEVSDFETVTDEYLDMVLTRKAQSSDIYNYVSEDLAEFDSADELFTSLCAELANNTPEEVHEFIDENKDKFQAIADMLQYLKAVYTVDKDERSAITDEKLTQAEVALNGVTAENASLTARLAELEAKYTKLLADYTNLDASHAKYMQDTEQNFRQLTETSKEEMDVIASDLADAKAQLNDVTGKLTASQIECDRKTNEINTLQSKLGSVGDTEELRACLQVMQKSKQEIESENTKLKQEITKLQDSVNKRQSSFTMYSPISMSSRGVKTRTVLYIKEITPLRYFNSMLVAFCKAIEMQKKEYKLVVVDNKADTNSLYPSGSVVGMLEYTQQRVSILNERKIITLIENPTVILSDILRVDMDILVLYDRLHMKQDLIAGNTVYKYWVASSRKDIQNAEIDFKPEEKYTFAMPCAGGKTIALPEIKEYRTGTPSAKMSKYYNLVNINEGDKARIFVSMLERMNMQQMGV